MRCVDWTEALQRVELLAVPRQARLTAPGEFSELVRWGTPMTTSSNLLWPYGRSAALVAIPVIWIIAALVLFASSEYLSWPDTSAAKFVVPLVLVVGFLPLALVLIDFAASSRAVLDIKGVKIDFSQEVRSSQIFGLPDNIGTPGEIVTDSSPMQIIEALEQATRSEAAVVDIRSGNTWWVTRLMALCAGAVRAGSPNAILFVGMRESIGEAFLGWATPSALLQALRNDKPDYDETYHRAVSIATQLVAFHGTELLPNAVAAGPQLILHSDVSRYAFNPDYVRRGAASLEQVLMDQLALKHESPPDRLTLGRLNQLFEHCLHRDVVDLSTAGDQQILATLRARGEFVALVNQDRYVGLLRVATGQRFVLEQLFAQANERQKHAG